MFGRKVPTSKAQEGDGPPRTGNHSAGGYGRIEEQTPEGPTTDTRASGCGGRVGRERPRGEGDAGNGGALAIRESLQGGMEPQERRTGKPGQEWMAEDVETVKTVRTEHAAGKAAVKGQRELICEWTPPLSSAEGEQNLKRGAWPRRPPHFGRWWAGRAPRARAATRKPEVHVSEGEVQVQEGQRARPRNRSEGGHGEDGEDQVERPRSRPERRNQNLCYPRSSHPAGHTNSREARTSGDRWRRTGDAEATLGSPSADRPSANRNPLKRKSRTACRTRPGCSAWSSVPS